MPDANKIIALGSDHGGFGMKGRVAEYLKSLGYEVLDVGTHSAERVDYPDYGYALAEVIAAGKASRGVAMCGSGIGISIALNRNAKVRAALCHDVTSTRLSREHNDANVLVMGARLIGNEVILECVKTFLNTAFEGGRHAERVEKLGKC